MNPAPTAPRFQDLLRQLLDGGPDAAGGVAGIAAAMSADATLRREYLDQMELDALLAWELGHGAALEPALTLADRHHDAATQPRRWYGRPRTILAAAAAIALCLGTGFFLGRQPVASLPATRPTAVAVLIDSEDCVWASGSQSWSFGSPFTQGESLHIVSGVARLAMQSKAGVAIEGPAEVTLVSSEEVRVMYGNVSAYAPEEAIGFKLTTPDVEIVDLGTRFAASVQKDGTTDVHVFEGEISVQSRAANAAGSADELVTTGQARRYFPGGSRRAEIALALDHFAAPPELEQLLAVTTSNPSRQTKPHPLSGLSPDFTAITHLLAAQNFIDTAGDLDGHQGGTGFANRPWWASKTFTCMIPAVASHSGETHAGGHLLIRGRDKAEPFVANRMRRPLAQELPNEFYFAIRASYHGLDADDFFSLWIDSHEGEDSSHANVPTLGIREGRYFARIDVEHSAAAGVVTEGAEFVLAGHYIGQDAGGQARMSLWVNPEHHAETPADATCVGPAREAGAPAFRFVGLRVGQRTEVSDKLLLRGFAVGRTLAAAVAAVAD